MAMYNFGSKKDLVELLTRRADEAQLIMAQYSGRTQRHVEERTKMEVYRGLAIMLSNSNLATIEKE